MLELTMTRLAEGLRADRSLALDELVTMVRDEIERSRNLPVIMARRQRRQEIHVIIIVTHPSVNPLGYS